MPLSIVGMWHEKTPNPGTQEETGFLSHATPMDEARF